jgi:hypothetical protein
MVLVSDGVSHAKLKSDRAEIGGDPVIFVG